MHAEWQHVGEGANKRVDGWKQSATTTITSTTTPTTNTQIANRRLEEAWKEKEKDLKKQGKESGLVDHSRGYWYVSIYI
jgi:hypothetical protein